MKKLIVAISALFLSATTAFSDVKMGISVAGVEFDSAKGTEEHKGDVTTESATLAAAYGSIFIEADVMGMFSVGLDYIPYDIEGETVSNQRRSDGGADISTSQGSADITEHVTLYALVPVGGEGAYVKVGATSAQVNATGVSNGASTTYSDDDMFGGHVSLGFERDVAEVFVRGEVGYSEYSTTEHNSSSGNTRIKAALGGGMHARISVGKSF